MRVRQNFTNHKAIFEKGSGLATRMTTTLFKLLNELGVFVAYIHIIIAINLDECVIKE